MKAPDAHLHRSDPVMARLIDDFGGPLPVEPDARGRPADLYGALVRGIAGQQLSVKAAASICRRLLERFDGGTPTPEQSSPTTRRSCASPPASRARRSPTCARSPSTWSPASSSSTASTELDDDEVIRELTAVKGIGEWTAHMFLMFTLHRPDVLPTGDLGVRNAVMRAYGLDAPPDRGTSRRSPSRGGRTARGRPCTCGAASTTSPSPDLGAPATLMGRDGQARARTSGARAPFSRWPDAAAAPTSSKDPVEQVPADGRAPGQGARGPAGDRVRLPVGRRKTLQQVAEEVKGGGSVEAGLATLGVHRRHQPARLRRDRRPGAVRLRPERRLRRPDARRRRREGPFAAPADVLVTQGRYRSKQAATEADPFAAVYEAHVPFDQKGPWSILTVTKRGNTFVAAPAQVQVNTKKADEIPDVGEQAPKVETDTIASVKGDEKLLDTRTPPSDMHESSFADVVGKKPVALLFATPQLCQSRVCGPVTDIALQMEAKYGSKVEFIHQEVYVDNDPNAGLRPPLEAFHLRTEPWLFVVGAEGRSPRGSRARSACGRSRTRSRPPSRPCAALGSPR